MKRTKSADAPSRATPRERSATFYVSLHAVANEHDAAKDSPKRGAREQATREVVQVENGRSWRSAW
eukprot:4143483-Pleurochrysis_carterae.AAC.1